VVVWNALEGSAVVWEALEGSRGGPGGSSTYSRPGSTSAKQAPVVASSSQQQQVGERKVSASEKVVPTYLSKHKMTTKHKQKVEGDQSK